MFTKLVVRRLRKAYNAVFLNKNTDPGQIVLSDLITRFRILDTTVVRDGQGRVDKDATLINEGNRQVVLHIFGMLNIDPNKFPDEVKRQVQPTAEEKRVF